MNVAKLFTILALLGAAVAVPALSFAAVNVAACESPRSRNLDHVSFSMLRSLNARSLAFFNQYNDFISSDEKLAERIAEIEKLTEDYFRRERIDFKKLNVDYQRTRKTGEPVLIRTHNYVIKSAPNDGGLNTRIFADALRDPRLKNLAIIIHPLLTLEKAFVEGYFERESKSIHFGVHGLLAMEMGTDGTVCHEIRHAVENAEVESGKPSLARFQVFGPQKPQEPYSMYMSFDELETHLADAKFLNDEKTELENELRKNGEEEKIGGLRLERRRTLLAHLQMLRGFVERAKRVLADARTRISSVDDRMSRIQSLSFTRLGANQDQSLQIQSRDLNSDFSRENSKSAALSEISWAEKRVQEISDEQVKIKSSLKPIESNPSVSTEEYSKN